MPETTAPAAPVAARRSARASGGYYLHGRDRSFVALYSEDELDGKRRAGWLVSREGSTHDPIRGYETLREAAEAIGSMFGRG